MEQVLYLNFNIIQHNSTIANITHTLVNHKDCIFSEYICFNILIVCIYFCFLVETFNIYIAMYKVA